MSFVSFMSLLKCLLSNKSACSISCLLTVKKHIYHPLYMLYKIHHSADKGLTPSCLGEIFLFGFVPKSASQMIKTGFSIFYLTHFTFYSWKINLSVLSCTKFSINIHCSLICIPKIRTSVCLYCQASSFTGSYISHNAS